MRIMLAFAAIPVVIWVATPGKPQPVVAKAVQSEGITARRMDDNTFRLRWSPVSDMPPTTEVRAREYVWQDRAGEARPSAERSDGSISAPATQSVGRRQGAPVRPSLHRHASLRTDICARHGMKRVNYGKRWRCRR